MPTNSEARKRAEEKVTLLAPRPIHLTEQQIETTLEALWILKELHEVKRLDFTHIDEVCFNLWMSKIHIENNKENQ
jgi:hypothetical protein